VVKITLFINASPKAGINALGLLQVKSFNLFPRPAAIIKDFMIELSEFLCVRPYTQTGDNKYYAG
jgi:hypothetical protein